MRECTGALLLAVLLAAASAPAASAQTNWRDIVLPQRTLVRTPVADPLAARAGVAVIVTDLLAAPGPEREPFTLPDPDDSAFDVVAGVSLGVVLPLVVLSEWESGAAMLVTEAKVFSRFRLEYQSRDDMGQDWFIGGGVEARDGPVSARALIVHRSSHIGDEFALATGASRIEFGSEQLDLLAGYDVLDGGRVYGGLSWIFRSYLDWDDRLEEMGIDDRAAVQLGVDREWRLPAGAPLMAWAGADVQAAERTGWQLGWALAAGVGLDTKSGDDAGRVIRLVLTWYDGPSTMGEFFLTDERYFGVEINAIL